MLDPGDTEELHHPHPHPTTAGVTKVVAAIAELDVPLTTQVALTLYMEHFALGGTATQHYLLI